MTVSGCDKIKPEYTPGKQLNGKTEQKEIVKMGLSKNFKIAMLQKDIKQPDLAAAINKDLQQVYNALYRDTFISKTGIEIATALNCDIVLRDRKTGKIY